MACLNYFITLVQFIITCIFRILKPSATWLKVKAFSKAAKLNEVTQSAVSQQLKAMESHYQMLIIDRNQKKFRLTPQGTALYSNIQANFESL